MDDSTTSTGREGETVARSDGGTSPLPVQTLDASKPRSEAAASGGREDMEVELSAEQREELLSLEQEMNKILDPQNTLRTPPPLIDLSPLECHALQWEELDALRAIYDHDMTPLNDEWTCFGIYIKFLSDEIKEEDAIRIWFSLPPNYPCVPPVFEIEANQSGLFTYRDADELFDLLMAEAINRIGGMMVFDLVTFAQEYLPGLVQHKKDEAARQAAMELDVKKIRQIEEVLKDGTKTTHLHLEPWSSNEPEEFESTRPTHMLYKPYHFIGQISELIKTLPELQIIRIENILRQDLADRFDKCLRSATKSLWRKERSYPEMFNLKPQIAFHGTRQTNLPSIVHRGLLIPGEGNAVRVCHGSSLGVGIYLSPDPTFSLHYSDTDRLIVCAALLGRMYKGTNREGFHSVYNCYMVDCEWVFFNAAQVLPCYVIQVKDQPGQGKQKSFHPPPLVGLQTTSLSHEDITEGERKAKLLARARKFLPYGFGPGGRTVIEDAASFDDDEEDYGDYQHIRYIEEDEYIHNYDKPVITESNELQEYRYKHSSDQTD